MKTAEEIEGWFKDGCLQANIDHSENIKTPYPTSCESELEGHWWTRGYAYQARILRALQAERELEKVPSQLHAYGEQVREEAARIAEAKAADRCLRHEQSGKGACGIQIADAIRKIKLP